VTARNGMDHVDVRGITYSQGTSEDRYAIVDVRCGRKTTTRVVPPAGEEYAFDRDDWDHHVQVHVSPTGRSVQVHVDGERVL
jgi:hypothetical protein